MEMKAMFKIGIDIGGTHTDAVLIDEKNTIVAFSKTETTRPLEHGFKTILERLGTKKISAIYVGTTHATNALLEGKDLFKVGVIRIAGHKPDTIPPCFGWPKFLKEAVFAGVVTINGGFECDGRSITPFNENEIDGAYELLTARGAESIAVIGAFSPINPEEELRVEEKLKSKIPVSLSYQLGGVGFIERENGTILNAALKKAMTQGFCRLEEAMRELSLTCPLFVTQNNGSLITLQQAVKDPLLTLSSGPTNSFIGASRLAGVHDAVIIDIGGTSTDIGVITRGYPRRSRQNSQIAGISLNFKMPDVYAIALGGGSYISKIGENNFEIGPKSCGRNLTREALLFGGDKLTLTDIAALDGRLNLPGADVSRVGICSIQAREVLKLVHEKISEGIGVMKGKQTHLPVIVVGGGAAIAQNGEALILPEYAGVANAYGAALAEISGCIDTVVSLTNREKTLEKLKEEALGIAISKGANPKTVRIVDVEIIPYHYIPGHLGRVVVTAAGEREIRH